MLDTWLVIVPIAREALIGETTVDTVVPGELLVEVMLSIVRWR